MNKSLTWWTIPMAAACLAVTSIGCGFFGSKDAEVAQVSEDDQEAAPKKSSSAESKPKPSKPANENRGPTAASTGGGGEAKPADSQGGTRSRGPTLLSSSAGGDSGDSGEAKGQGSGARSRGPSLLSGDISGGSDSKKNSNAGDGHSHDDGDSHSHGPGPAGPGASAGGGEDISGQGGPPEGADESGYGSEDISGQGGPPEGADESGYGNEDISGQGGAPAGMEGDDPYGSGGVDISGGGGPEGEMEGDGGYPDGGPGAGPGAGPGPGFPGAGPGQNPGAAGGSQKPKAEPKSPGLLGKAEQAMAEGREKDAFQYLYALALTEDENDLFSKFGWVAGLRRPSLAVRWAVGVDLKVSPRSYKGSLYPIGSNQNLPARNPRRGGGGDFGGGGFPGPGGGDGPGFPGAGGGPGPGFPGAGGGMGGGGASGSQAKLLGDFAGTAGKGVVDALAERVENGSFGEVLQDFSEFVNAQSAGGTGSGFASGGPGPGFPGGGEPGGGGFGPAGFGAGAGGEPGGLGGGGEGMEEEFGEEGGDDLGTPDLGQQGGGGGAAPAAGARGGDGHDHDHAGPGPGRNQNRPPANNSRTSRRHSGPPQLAAGVIFLGTGNGTTLRRKATDQGVDLLLIFDVDVSRSSRTGVVKTSTKALIVDIVKGEVIARMKSLSNVTVQKAVAKGDDPVGEWLDSFVEKLDDSSDGFVMSNLPPGLKPEHAKARVQRLAADYASSPGNPLPVLAEVALYYSRNLIDDDTRTAVYQQILGKQPGEQLSLGNAKERMAVLQRWLPRD